ncbi:phosphate ABC transporter ATP-binding protein [Nitrosospira sp. Is2]|nr:phosphate ABC transporter ATP-binding protein [Nitrosospira sp. Is2]WON75167.1 phosphate ABC transporter ATP-binding protein [Nitrosospira sp. Is2]
MNIKRRSSTTASGHFIGQDDAYTLGPMQLGPACCEPQPVIEVENFSLSYGARTALESLSLNIYRGCITALIGPSGCGKTSFLSSLNRLTDLIPGCRITGRIRIDNCDIHDPACDLRVLRRKIGMVFQKPAPFPLSIHRNIELPLREHGITRRGEADAIIQRVLQDVGLWEEVHDRLHTSALSLSGGQQQRLCIARALALNPQILLMDEPCSALDPIASGVVEDLIERLRGRYTIVIVTHNLAQARRIANYAAFFWIREHAGQLVEFGHCRQIFESPAHELTAAYINGARG